MQMASFLGVDHLQFPGLLVLVHHHEGVSCFLCQVIEANFWHVLTVTDRVPREWETTQARRSSAAPELAGQGCLGRLGGQDGVCLASLLYSSFHALSIIPSKHFLDFYHSS